MARGVALLALADAGLAVMTAARRVKQNITGSGRADKAQVTAMISRLLGVTPQSVDSVDALAIAIAAAMKALRLLAPSFRQHQAAGSKRRSPVRWQGARHDRHADRDTGPGG